MQTTTNSHPELVLPVDVKALTQALAAPFDAAAVKFKPAVVSGHRALALAYVDARVIQDRLDAVLGVEGWQDEYELLPDGSVLCRLRLRLGDAWIEKQDVGSPSEQPDGGDRMKAAFSDALKRAAVKFGIGRYLYRLPIQWVDYDPQQRQFVRTPVLPAFALPSTSLPATPPIPQKGSVARPDAPKSQAAAGTQTGASRGNAKLSAATLPANGAELQRRLYDHDARLAAQGICQQGDLVKHIVQAGVRAGYDPDLSGWSGPAILLAVEETKAFEARYRSRKTEQRDVA